MCRNNDADVNATEVRTKGQRLGGCVSRSGDHDRFPFGFMVDDGVGPEAQVRPAKLLRDMGVAHRHAADVALVDHGAVPRGGGLAVVPPGELGLDHDGLRHLGCVPPSELSGGAVRVLVAP